MDLGIVDRDGALEHAVLRDLEDARVEGGLDAAFHHQRVAIADLDALDLDLGADDELGFLALLAADVGFGFGGRGGRCVGSRHGRGGDWQILAERTFFAPAEEPVFL
jgi:hypothetical protein